MLTPMALREWVMVVTKRDAQTAQSFMNTLGRVCPPMGEKSQDVCTIFARVLPIL